jgi:hypothetical protein
MPWFPDFIAAAELARREVRAAGQADPVAQYLTALDTGDAHGLETVWPGHVVVHDPRAGEVRGHRQLRQFVQRSHALLVEHAAHTEREASTCVGGRAVVELLAHLLHDGTEVLWPVAVVAESLDDVSIEFRTYCSLWPIDGHRSVRGPVLRPGPAPLDGVVGRYHSALAAGDVDAVVDTFAATGYLREPIGPDAFHRGLDELREYFSAGLGDGGIELETCGVTDDGVRCALEYNCVRWGSHELPPQAGIAVFERSPDGLLAAVRVYDDVEAPVIAA